MNFPRTGGGTACLADEPFPRAMEALHVLRVGGSSAYDFLSVAAEAIVFKTHYYRKRTVPCPGGECPACGTGRPRFYAYLAVVNQRGNKGQYAEVVEVPVRTMEALQQGVKFYAAAESCSTPLRGVLGSRFVVRRAGGVKRGQLHIEVIGVGLPCQVVQLEQVAESVCRLWGVPGPRGKVDSEEWRDMVRKTIRRDEHYRVGS